MSLTQESVRASFAPLASPATAQAFFSANVADEVVWTWGAPGAKHLLAGRYEGLVAFFGGTFGRITAMMDGPMSITVESVIVEDDRAAVELRTQGQTKVGKALDERACWIVRATHGVITEVTSYIDSAALLDLIEDNKAMLDQQ